MKLVIAGTEKEALMFRLLGVSPWVPEPVTSKDDSAVDHDDVQNRNEAFPLLLGSNEVIPLDLNSRDSLCYVRLPVSDHSDQETQRLCRLLAQAVGQKEIHL